MSHPHLGLKASGICFKCSSPAIRRLGEGLGWAVCWRRLGTSAASTGGFADPQPGGSSIFSHALQWFASVKFVCEAQPYFPSLSKQLEVIVDCFP